MAGKADYAENKTLDAWLNNTAIPTTATYYVALYTVAPTDSTAGTEVTTGAWSNYARVGFTRNTTNFPAASGGAISNGVAIDFGTATIPGTAPVVVAMAIIDTSSGAGNIIYWANLVSSKTINNGDPVKFAVGDLDVTED